MTKDRIVGNSRKGEKKAVQGVKELGVFDQARLIIPLLGGLKKAILITLILFVVSALVLTLFLGIGLAIAVELVVIMLAIFLIAPYIKLKRIPNMHIGVPLVLNERQSAFILKEGWAIVIKGIFDYIPVYVGKPNLDFFLVVRAKDNAQVKLHVSMLMRADKFRIIEFLDAGGRYGEGIKEEKEDKGIADTIIDMAKSSITATSKTKNLDQILEIDGDITAKAIEKITGKEVSKGDAIRANVEQKVPGIGTVISNFVIKEPEPVGKIADVFEKQAVEDLEKKFELTNIETKMEQIQLMIDKLKESGQTIDANSIFLILTEQELLEKGYKITPGLNRLLNSIATMIESGAGIADAIDFFNKFRKGDS